MSRIRLIIHLFFVPVLYAHNSTLPHSNPVYQNSQANAKQKAAFVTREKHHPSIPERIQFQILTHPMAVLGITIAITGAATLAIGYYLGKKVLPPAYNQLSKLPVEKIQELLETNRLGEQIAALQKVTIVLQSKLPQEKPLSLKSNTPLSHNDIPTGETFLEMQKSWIPRLQENLREVEKYLATHVWNQEEAWNNILQEQPAPTGLKNNGNTCYRNATLQSIHHLFPEIYKACILKEEEKPELQANQTFQDFKTFARSRTLNLDSSCTNLANTFKDFEKLCLSYINPAEPTKQQDAQEFFDKFFETNQLSKKAQTYYKGKEKTLNELTEAQQAIGSIFEQIITPSTLVQQVISSATESSKTTPHVITLDIPETKTPITLTDLFTHTLGAEEKISEYGPNKEDATKTTTIEQISSRLCLHIQRHGDRKKRNEKIAIPLELTIPDTCFSNQKAQTTKYQLKSIVSHIGNSLHGGHYVAYVCHGDQWYYCSDSCIQKIEPQDLAPEKISGTPYVVFYEALKTKQNQNHLTAN